MSTDQRESQLSAMFDAELPDTECELLARRLSRDATLKQQWARYALIGAVIRHEPLRMRRDPGGALTAGIAGRLVTALDAEPPQSVQDAVQDGAPGATERAGALAGADGDRGDGLRRRWVRPVAGFAIAAGVAALSVFWLQGRAPDAAIAVAALDAGTPQSQAVTDAPAAAREIDVIAPPVETRGARAEIVVAGNGYPAAVVRGPGNGEPESYVVPLPSGRAGTGPSAQLANYVVAHSEFTGPLSRRSLLSALVASEAAVEPPLDAGAAAAAAVVAPAPAPAPAPAGSRTSPTSTASPGSRP